MTARLQDADPNEKARNAPDTGLARSSSGTVDTDETRKKSNRNEDGSQKQADQGNIITVERDGEKYEALASDPSDGPMGMSLATAAGEVAGGNIKKVLDPPEELLDNATPLTKERQALTSTVGKKIAPFVGRPITEWGLIGEGEIIKGHMLLLDLETGEKVRAFGDHKVEKGRLYANLRNFPESLSGGDTLEKIISGA